MEGSVFEEKSSFEMLYDCAWNAVVMSGLVRFLKTQNLLVSGHTGYVCKTKYVQ